MQIHEITKGPRRTDEGILDNIKKSIDQSKTDYSIGKVRGGVGQAVGNFSRALGQNYRQNKINASTAKNMEKLYRQGYDVAGIDPKTGKLDPNQLASAGTPGNMRRANRQNKEQTMQQQRQQQQNLQQLQQQFVQTFVGPVSVGGQTLNPSDPAHAQILSKINAQQGAASAQTTQPVQPAAAVQPAASAAPAANTMANAPGTVYRKGKAVQEDMAQRFSGAQTKQSAQTANPAIAQKISTEFPKWIDNKIPGLSDAKKDPTLEPELKRLFLALKSSARKGTDALLAAFNEYVKAANNAVSKFNTKTEKPAGQSGAVGSKGSTGAKGNEAKRVIQQIGLTPDVAKQVKNKIERSGIPPEKVASALFNYPEW
jgi:hypothetical protein